MSSKKSLTLTEPMAKKLNHFAKKWDVSEAEAMRRLFGMGSFLAEEIENEHILYSEDPATKEKDRLVFNVK